MTGAPPTARARFLAMVALVVLAHSGAQMFKGNWIQRYGDSAAGALIVATGVLVAVLEW